MQKDIEFQSIVLANQRPINRNGFDYSRFRFPISWKGYYLHELFEIRGGKPISRNNMGNFGSACIHYGDIHTSGIMVFNISQMFDQLPKIPDGQIDDCELLRDGDILFADASEDYDGIGKSIVVDNPNGLRAVGGLHTIIASDKSALINKVYKKYLFSNWLLRKQFMFYAQGISVYGISKSNIESVLVVLPPIEEQQKIAAILSTWDHAIHSLQKLIELEQLRKKSLVDQVFNGLMRKSDGIFSFERLNRHLREKNIRNKEHGVERIMSVSNNLGFIPQSDQFDREVASKDKSNYKVVSKGDFAYNPSRINVGSIDLLTKYDEGIVSPMYVVFTTKPTIHRQYLYHYLKSDVFLRRIPQFTQGSVRDSLSFDGLCGMKIYLPSMNDQIAISRLLDSIDEKILLLESSLVEYMKQKQGLMQQLLTGKIRVMMS